MNLATNQHMLIGILSNEDPQSSVKWQLACDKADIPYRVIDLTANTWLDAITHEAFDFFLLKPPGLLERFKILYDERVYIINKVLLKTTFPSYEEIVIYENKKMLAYFLESTGIPHPKTYVMYRKDEVIELIKKVTLPLVGKSSIGASGSGVIILNSKSKIVNYINKSFSGRGIKRRFGPNQVTGTPKNWMYKALKSPQYFVKKIKEYVSIYKDGQKGYVILQEYISHEFEWRVVRIGDSYFAHKKVKYKDKASGSKGIDYVNPPLVLLDFVRDICVRHGFNFMAIDLFEDTKGKYLVNELQTIFGHVQDFIMSVDGIPGRYVFINSQWIFEPGSFNNNESYDLRLKTAVELYERG
jgi:glutathione synthase/RimK-type ligase-like ATP-grasp enzyme